MEEFVKGSVVILPFPFSDLSKSKKRPALVVANLERGDLILCQITSKIRTDKNSIVLKNTDFSKGRLPLISLIRTDKLFTAHKSIILYKIGKLKESKIRKVEKEIINLFKK